MTPENKGEAISESALERRFHEAANRVESVIFAMESRLKAQGSPTAEELAETEEQKQKIKQEIFQVISRLSSHRIVIQHILEHTVAGSAEQPSMILEIGGGNSPRGYAARELSAKNLIVGNIDIFPEWGDRKFQVDINNLEGGLNDSRLVPFFEHSGLGSVAMSHAAKFFSFPVFKGLVSSAMDRMAEGAGFIIHDTNITSAFLLDARKALHAKNSALDIENSGVFGILKNTLHAFNYLSSVAQRRPDDFHAQQYMIGIGVPRKVAEADPSNLLKKMYGTMQRGETNIVLHEATLDDLESKYPVPVTGNQFLIPMFSERIGVLTKGKRKIASLFKRQSTAAKLDRKRKKEERRRKKQNRK